jgi:predicted glycosyltransferase
MAVTSQKRALFFVFDAGTGVGHLRRLACIAKQLQGDFSCLIVTGHRAAAHWFVPAECEYIHLPSWDSLLESKSRYWGLKPFVCLDERAAVRMRKDLLAAVVAAFAPDAIFVDHLPLGAYEELADVIADAPCRKYLVTRGVLNETENLRELILGGKALQYLKVHYHRTLVAADPRVFDFSRQYASPPEVYAKTVHTGYVIEKVPEEVVLRTRRERGLKSSDTWVVASAGGGQMGERLIEDCLALARKHTDIVFDIVSGPRSSLPWAHSDRSVIAESNFQLHKETCQMPYLHASADLVVSSGGYNSMLEALQGNARILCFPSRKDKRDEQYQHAARLRKFVDLDLSNDLAELPALFERAVEASRSHSRPDRRSELNFDGAANIAKLVRAEFGFGA